MHQKMYSSQRTSRRTNRTLCQCLVVIVHMPYVNECLHTGRYYYSFANISLPKPIVCTNGVTRSYLTEQKSTSYHHCPPSPSPAKLLHFYRQVLSCATLQFSVYLYIQPRCSEGWPRTSRSWWDKWLPGNCLGLATEYTCIEGRFSWVSWSGELLCASSFLPNMREKRLPAIGVRERRCFWRCDFNFTWCFFLGW